MASGLFFVDVDLFCFLADFLNYTYLCFKSLLSIFSAMILISTVLSNFLIFSFFQASRMFLMGEVSSNTPSVFILFSLFTLYYVYLSFILGKFHISSDAWLSIHFHEWSNDQKLWMGVQVTFWAVKGAVLLKILKCQYAVCIFPKNFFFLGRIFLYFVGVSDQSFLLKLSFYALTLFGAHVTPALNPS